jgi:hypothetical protein
VYYNKSGKLGRISYVQNKIYFDYKIYPCGAYDYYLHINPAERVRIINDRNEYICEFPLNSEFKCNQKVVSLKICR